MIFPGQHPGEDVLLLVRRHWIALLKQTVVFLIGALVPVGVGIMLSQYTTALDDTSQASYVLVVLGMSVYALAILLFFFVSWIDYYLDVWIVTKTRILTIEQKGLFSRSVSELTLERMQDVTSEVHGLIATMMHYGDIRIQTAGEQSQFVFKQVPRPYETARKIMELHAVLQPAQVQPKPQAPTSQIPPQVPPTQPPTGVSPVQKV